MKTSQSFRIYFTIKRDKEKAGMAPLYVSITVNKEKCFVALKKNVATAIWDFGKGAAKGTKEEAKELNAYLEDVRLALGNIYKDLQLKGSNIDANIIKNAFTGEKEEKYTLSGLISYHNEIEQNSLKASTLKHYFVTQRYLMNFVDIHYKASDFYLSDLNYRFVQDFEVYLSGLEPKGNLRPLNNNGIMKHIIRLKKMIHLAVKLEWLDKDPFVNYKLKMKKVSRGYLTEVELKAVETKIFTIERVDTVRDLFVFCCYTGLSFVDVMALKPEYITTDVEGGRWIRTIREKTLIPVVVPLLPKALEILEKYKCNKRSLSYQKVFPQLSNQKVNAYLKEVADTCGIPKEITFHQARHTFATTVTLSNGMPIETVSKILGHHKIATTQIYARVVEKKLKDDMKNLMNVLKTKVK